MTDEPRSLAKQRLIDIPTIVNLSIGLFEPYTLDGPEYEALLRWLPISFDTSTMRGSYFFEMLPGAVTKAHTHRFFEEFLILDGEVIESNGLVLRKGDFAAYKPGSHHSTRSETGCMMIVFEWSA